MATFKALVDTGADSSFVSLRLVDALGLTRVNKRPRVITDVEGRHKCDAYDAHLTLGDLQIPSPRELVAYPRLSEDGSFDVILGQDILCHCLMYYEGPKGHLQLLRPE